MSVVTEITLDSAMSAMTQLAKIENDMAERQGDLESAAQNLPACKRAKEKAETKYNRAHKHLAATAYKAASGTVGDREAAAVLTLQDDKLLLRLEQDVEFARDALAEAEGDLEAKRRVMGVLESRASAAQSILKTMRDGVEAGGEFGHGFGSRRAA